jgi:alpha-glucoside transport system substrate-binding protein
VRPHADRLAAVLTAVLLTGCAPSTGPVQLEVFGPYLDGEADLFADVAGAFEAESGVEVRYTGSAAFSPDLARRMAAGDLPDVILLPQPGVLDELAASGRVVPLSADLGARVLATVGPGWEEAITRNGAVVAVPYRVVVTSLVWYRPDEFEKRGYQVPGTLRELDELTARMRSDGITPWCAGMNDFDSTGWWGTDWVEDLVLRRSGVEAYLAWSRLEEPFDGEQVGPAIEALERVIGTEGNVLGGRRAVNSTLVTEAIRPMLAVEPRCLMLKQASFQIGWLPPGAAFGDGTLDVFPLPAVEPGPAPIVIGGEVAVMTSGDPRAESFVEFLLDAGAERPRGQVGGSLAPRVGQDPFDYESAFDRRLVEILRQATVVVFDASDLMPGEVGSGAFWRGMTDLVGGRPASQVAADIQQAAFAASGR